RRWLALLGLLLLALLIAWLAWPDRSFAKAKQLQKELSDPKAREMSSEERRAKWRDYRETEKRLSPAQRQKLRGEANKRRQAEMARYFRMSPQDKARYLDEQIKRGEQMRQRWQQQGGPGGPGGQPGGAGGAGQARRDGPSGSRDDRRRERLDMTT